jgi:cytochrome c oxidase subunit I
MSVAPEQSHPASSEHHAAPQGFIRKWVFSKDHKVIGIQYIFLAMAAVFVGMALSLVMRAQLAFPNQMWPTLSKLFPRGMEGGILTPEFYLSMVTMHGTIMVFFVLTTAPQGGFGNYFLPIQIGARDMAFPTLNMMSFWITFVAFVTLMAAFFVEGGAPLGGWTAYPPLSALGEIAAPGQGMGMNLWILSIALFCLASLLGALNFLSTTLAMRAKGMSLMRMPLTCWAWFTTAVLSLLAFPVLLGAGILLLLDRVVGTSFFLPAGLVVSGTPIPDHAGGSPILWQHLFWFFGHPEVYIAIIPGMGATSQILATFARKPIFGYKAMVVAIFAIGGLGFFVWGHHMLVSGMSPYSAIAFSLITLTIGVPSAIKTVNWLGTIWGGKIRFTAAMLFALGFVSLFVTGGLGGIFLGQTSVDLFLHDTYFVVGHFHLIMGVAAIFGIAGAIYFWFPKMFGRMMNETMGKVHFLVSFVGVYLIFVPMHAIGFLGHPRRYYDGTEYQFLQNAAGLQGIITWSAVAVASIQLLFFFNFFWSLFKGKKAPVNPWECTTLEWTVSSPPPHENFDSDPEVHHGPYEYSVPGAEVDFIMQDAPPSAAQGSQ